MARTGRKSTLTPEKHREIVTAIRAGVAKSIAIRAARVEYKTFLMWMRKGEKLAYGAKAPVTDYEKALVEFFNDILAAEAEAERLFASIVSRDAIENKSVSSAKYILERRWPKRWVYREQVAHSGGVGQDADDAPIEVEFVLAAPKKPVAASDSFEEEDASGKD